MSRKERTVNQWQEEYGEWSTRVFGTPSLFLVIDHLEEEVEELRDAVEAVLLSRKRVEMGMSVIDFLEENESHVGEELADVGLFALRLADLLGKDLDWEMDRKFEINKRREWMQNDDGLVRHKKEDDGER